MIPFKNFKLEFILHTYNTSLKQIESSLAEFGEGLKVLDCSCGLEKGNSFKVYISAEDPTIVFDVCSQFGRIRSVKVNEIG